MSNMRQVSAINGLFFPANTVITVIIEPEIVNCKKICKAITNNVKDIKLVLLYFN